MDVRLLRPLATEPSSGLTISRSAATLLGLALAAAWVAGSATLIRGWGFWLESPDRQFHFLSISLCTALVIIHAGRTQGSFDQKLARTLAAVAVVFGAYALLILGARLFFSRPMLASNVVGAAFVGALVVWLRHRLTSPRVAVIAPALPALPALAAAVRFGHLITDPDTDMRGYDYVLIALKGPLNADWGRAISRAMLSGCKVRHVAEYIEEMRGAVVVDEFELEHLTPNGIASYRPFKRALDVALVVFIAPVALPLLLLAALAIALTSRGSIFYVQERIGLGAEPFRMYKLRTMRPTGDGDPVRPAVPGDRRVTPVGRILRRFRIDELPQLWNVLKGDMSLIGPRPEATSLHQIYSAQLPNYAFRYLVRPGITGWAQVNSPPSASADEARVKLTYDLYYVKKLSLYLDLKIVLKTLWTIVDGAGVR